MSSNSVQNVREDYRTHFAFGQNWREYAKMVTEAQIAEARTGLLRLIRADEMAGKSFLDIGCGSGLHSLVALQCGVEHVVAIDVDENSVSTAHTLLNRFWSRSDKYNCRIGNILTGVGLPEEQVDIVYSWGVLHHTGAMWEAIEKASRYVKPGGKLIIAIYLKTMFCDFWEWEKRFYSKASPLLQIPILLGYSTLCVLRMLLKGVNPVQHIRTYNINRGMSWWHDRIDWLGGWPYESATPKDVIEFLKRRGFALEGSYGTARTLGLLGSGCAEYVFKNET
jgi:2-polyprenyl-6-hydroxyphenyl methylase/3-demethylubiquinone-9 3-methyltransferase